MVIRVPCPTDVSQAGNLVRATKRSQITGTFLHYMVIVYVIESLLDNTWYTGIAINPVNRLKEHNTGKNRFTKGHRPWKIIYTEPYPDWAIARKKEKYFKTANGKRWLRKFLSSHGDTSSLPD